MTQQAMDADVEGGTGLDGVISRLSRDTPGASVLHREIVRLVNKPALLFVLLLPYESVGTRRVVVAAWLIRSRPGRSYRLMCGIPALDVTSARAGWTAWQPTISMILSRFVVHADLQ